jgi:hypothetical protein
MDAYIPIGISQTVETDILVRLENHLLIDDVWIHPTKEFYPRGDQRRYKAIAENKLRIYKHAIKTGNEFFLTCNSNNMHADVRFSPDKHKTVYLIDGLDMMLKYLQEHPKCGVAAGNPFRVKRNPYHVSEGFTMIRTEAAKCVKFDMSYNPRCECVALKNEMNAAGWDMHNVNHFLEESKKNH